jgi:hypothetical protein
MPKKSKRPIEQYPHCDSKVLHRPGTCTYCDEHPDWQELRVMWDINFTGENEPGKSQCPSERLRSARTIHMWPGNRPTNVNVPIGPRTATERIDEGVFDDVGEPDE